MKGWKIIKPLTVKELDVNEPIINGGKAKIKMTKTLISLSDIIRYNDSRLNAPENNFVLGNYGIGIVSETDANFFGLDKGKRVYIEPYKPCEECYNCKKGDTKKCSDILVAGEDYDGFLCDFYSTNSDKLFI